MKATSTDVKIAAALSVVIVAILILVPFHAFLTVWAASLVGHYTLLRLWEEVLLVVITAGALVLLYKNAAQRQRLLHSRLIWLVAAYMAVQILWGIVAYATHSVTAKALGYGWIVNLRFLLFFVDVWIIASCAPTRLKQWPKYVIWPMLIVLIIGLLQYFVLPYNFLEHFGYSKATIYPYETINHNLNYIRVMSTLRGANPLGAYLIVAIMLTLALWRRQKRIWQVALAAAGVVVLVLSFSRSAWIGLVLSLGYFLWLGLRSGRSRRLVLIGLGAVIIVAGASALAFRHNTTFENTFFHTSHNSKIAKTSDEGHASSLRDGLHDVATEPLGRGPGTAGPASQYNHPHSVRIAENYFLQVGQETGWLGLILFIAINALVAKELWQRRKQTLALGLLTAFVGVTFVNLLSHAWADVTLAYLWWGLAAVALALPLAKKASDEV